MSVWSAQIELSCFPFCPSPSPNLSFFCLSVCLSINLFLRKIQITIERSVCAHHDSEGILCLEVVVQLLHQVSGGSIECNVNIITRVITVSTARAVVFLARVLMLLFFPYTPPPFSLSPSPPPSPLSLPSLSLSVSFRRSRTRTEKRVCVCPPRPS